MGSLSKTASLALALLVGVWVSGTPAGAVGDEAADTDSKPLVVKIHADWCGTCTRLEPTWKRLENDLGARARFVLLDVTDRDSLERARARAEALGVGAFFEAHKGKTGTIGVLDGATGEAVAVFKGELDVAPYEAAVAKLEGGRS